MRFSSVSFIMSSERKKTVDIIIREAFHMKHRRKALALLAALLPLSLAACGNGNPSADTKSAKEEAFSESSSTDASNGNEGGSRTLGADSYVTEFSGSTANVISSGHAFLYVNGMALTGMN